MWYQIRMHIHNMCLPFCNTIEVSEAVPASTRPISVRLPSPCISYARISPFSLQSSVHVYTTFNLDDVAHAVVRYKCNQTQCAAQHHFYICVHQTTLRTHLGWKRENAGFIRLVSSPLT